MAMNVWDHFGNTVSRDLLDMCIGTRLGGGLSREVFSFGPDPSLVIKIETEAGHFQNIIEWHTWERIERTRTAKWFAPCVRISDDGKILLMKRTQPLGWEGRRSEELRVGKEWSEP